MARLIVVEDNAELASLIAAAAEERGHSLRLARTVQEALTALVDSQPDVAIVDLLLPDQPGTDVLLAMKAAGVPALAMSGVFKGERCAKEAVDEYGAVAFFEKPFDLLALLDAAEKAAGITPTPPREPAPDDLEELRELASTPDAPDAPAPSPAETFELPFAKRSQVWSGGQGRGEGGLPAWSRAGTIQAGTVPRLLAAYHQARHSGELKLSQGPVVKVVYFESGTPVYAASNLAHERFARFCVRKGLFAESELAAVAALAHEAKIRTGEALVRLGLVDAEQRTGLLAEQVREILWSTFGWEKGEYALSARRPNRGDLVRISVFPADLILEGVLKTETLLSLRRKLPSDRKLFPSSDPPFGLHEVKFGNEQALLVAATDGSKTVEDLIALTDLSERDALGTLYALVLLGFVEERAEDRSRRRITFGL